MHKDEIASINSLIEKNKIEIFKIKNEMKISLEFDNLNQFKYEDKFLIKYSNMNYYLFQGEEEAIPLEEIEVIFLFEKERKLIHSESFYFYSFGSIIKACDILNMKKPLIIKDLLNKDDIYKKGLDKKYQKKLFYQLCELEIVNKIYIIDLFENQSNLKNNFKNIFEYKHKLKMSHKQLLSKDYTYNNKNNFYEYFNTCFLDKNEDINTDENTKKNNEFFFICNNERKELLEFLKFYFNFNTTYNVLYLLGPMSAGKTSTLIHFKNLSLYPILYLNLKTINSLESKERLNILTTETLLFFNDLESQNKFFENYEEKLDINTTLIIMIKNLINKNKNFLLIIDQYKTKYDIDGEMKKNLLSLFKNNMDARFLFCSSINDLENRIFILKNIFSIISGKSEEKYLDDTNAKYVDGLFTINKRKIKCSKEKRVILKEFNWLPRIANKILCLDDNAIYNFKEKEKNKIIQKINDFLTFNKIEDELFFNAFFEWKEYEESGQNLKEENFKNIVKYLPLKYFRIKKIVKYENEYKIETIFPFIEDIIEEMFVKRVYDLLIKINKLPESLRGYVFEFAVILSIEKKYKNIIRKKVKNIYKLNYNKENELDLNTDNIYSIRQKNISGSYYDFCLFFGKEKKLVLFQITIHKDWKDITPLNFIQKNCEEIMSNINIKNKKIISENDIYFYFVIPNIQKDGDPEYNKKMKIFINDLNKYKYQYLEYDIVKNDFKNYKIDFGEKSNSKVFNNISPVIQQFNFQDKQKSLEINNIKLECNKNFLGKKYHRENQLKELENEALNYFNKNKILYQRFLSFCNINKDNIPIIINKKASFNDIFLNEHFILVIKDNDDDDYCILHKKGGKVEIYSLKEEKIIEFNFCYIYNYSNYCLFQIIEKRNLKTLDIEEKKTKYNLRAK